MGARNFVHLHLHTDFSLLDGACDLTELVEETARRGAPAVAVTDHGNLFAAANFYNTATSRNVKPIIGCEVYVARGSRLEKTSDPEAPGAGRANHLLLLCENNEGYRNLVKLVSSGFLEGFYYKPRIDHDLLAKHSRGLIALSSCLRGEVAEALTEGKYEESRNSAYRLRDIFGKGNFFLEIQDQDLDIEHKINPDLVRMSKETGIPLVATNDCHYLREEDARAQEVLMCIQTGKTMSEPNRMRFATNQFFYKTADQMAQVFGEIPEVLDRTLAIAERCNVKIERVANPFPEFKVPEGHTIDSYFEKVSREGFAGRLPQLDRLQKEGRLLHPLSDYEARLTLEIEMIKKMKFAGYFLVVWDFIHYAKAQGVPVGPGRGSAAGSLVSYALRITDVDPLQYNLLFERFLNPERVSMPDIDIDFCMLRRGEVINYVTEKYGRDNVAQIITFGTMAAKAAIKDVGRALDMPYGDVDRLAKMVPPTLNIELEDALKQSPQLKQAEQSDEKVAELIHIAKRLEGLARHASTHAAGVVISPQPLTEFVPLYKSNRDEITTQYDMNALERIGLLKMDFLGLTTLTVLVDAKRLVQQNRNVEIDLDGLPLDDAETYKLFTRGDTTGIFQFESHGMRDILRKYQPSRIEDLTALNALYRPGPIQGGMIDDFIQRKHGKKKVVYELPELKDILEETFGVMVYQEQVMQIANRLAGFSLGDADLLRRAMGKKKPEEMAKQKEKFLSGCVANKVNEKKAEKIFDLMAEFAGYGFNKSHSCAYALLAYQTAYLKAHYPVEFMAAMMTAETGNTEKVVKYINEARSMGITVLPPDVNTSGMDFTPVSDAIRFGLRAIKNVGENTVKGILEAREQLTRFRSLFQFCESIDPRLINRRVIESLIKAGAMDSLGAGRRPIFEVIDKAMERGQKLHRDKTSGQHGLFGGPAPQSPFDSAAPEEHADPPLPSVEEWPEEELLAGEFSTLGFYVSSHPLAKYAARLKELGVTDISALDSKANDEEVRLAGLLQNLRVLRSKKGERWAVMTLQDMTGQAELLVFAKVFAIRENVLKVSTPLIVKGRVSVEDAGIRIIVSDVRPLDQIADPPRPLCVRIDSSAWSEQKMEELDQILRAKQGPSAVDFEIVSGEGVVTRIQTSRKVQADEDLFSRVRTLCGPESIQFVSRNGH